jgi:hypothetical protein
MCSTLMNSSNLQCAAAAAVSLNALPQELFYTEKHVATLKVQVNIVLCSLLLLLQIRHVQETVC